MGKRAVASRLQGSKPGQTIALSIHTHTISHTEPHLHIVLGQNSQHLDSACAKPQGNSKHVLKHWFPFFLVTAKNPEYNPVSTLATSKHSQTVLL